jgi:very-short-patch-repair endonuclease
VNILYSSQRWRRRWFKRINRWSTPFRVIVMIGEQIKMGIVPRIDRQLIRTESPIERRLYYALREEGYKVETQVRCGKFLIDLALPEYRVAIEADGKKYHSSESQKAHDREKDRYLKNQGWTVLGASPR